MDGKTGALLAIVFLGPILGAVAASNGCNGQKAEAPAAVVDAGPPAPSSAQKIGHIDAKDRPQEGGCDVWRFEGELFSICGLEPKAKK